MRLTILLAAFYLMSITPVAAQIRIGYIDLRKALNSVEDGKKAKSILKSKKKKLQRLLNRKQKKLKREKKLYESRATILRGQAKRKAQLKLQKKFFTLQRMYTKYTRQLARQEAIVTRRIFRKMESIIRKIAKENNLYLMLEKTESSVLYALPQMDYTSELIRRYNRKYHGRKTKRRRRRRRRRKRRRRRRRK